MSETIDLEFEFSIDDIMFKGKTLTDWESEFTISIPGVHLTSQEMQKHIITLNNKYHLAYNCYNELLISHGKIEQDYNIKKGIAIKVLVDSMRADGAGRLPAKDVLGEMVLSSNAQLKEAHQQLILMDIIKTFFENNKTKLEKTMQLIINLSYMISASDKMHYKSGDPTI
jgi:hypothetical protein